jgi:DNA-binding response OmpR family regulator
MVEKLKTIICIDDEPGILDLIELILKREGFNFVGVQGGRGGIEAVRELRPDLVLLDLMMPDVNGWEVYWQMKADEATKDIPVIIVTVRAGSKDRVMAQQIAKVDAYLTKPFLPEELVQRIHEVLGQGETR